MKKLILRSYHLALLYTTCLLLSYAPLYGQETYNLDEIFEAYEAGYHQSLRDVFSLLDNTTDEPIIRRVRSGLLLDLQDPLFHKSQNVTWLQYYYEHHDQIQYYPEWGLFLRNDISIPNLSFAILDSHHSQPSKYITKARSIYNTINDRSIKQLVPIIESLSLPEVSYSNRILLECLDLLTDVHPCDKVVAVYAAIASKLLILNDQFIHQKIHQVLIEKSCSTQVLKDIETQILKSKENSLLYTGEAAQFESYRNSQFITHLKTEAYAEALNIQSSYFNNEVDHYGKLLSAIPKGNTTDEDEIINILIHTESPKAIYYIISRWFSYAKTAHTRADQLMDIVTTFTDNNIQINTPNGRAYECNQETTDLMALKSILAFWINNHKHYEWNQDINKYVNTNILKQDRQKLIQLYKNLNNDNTDLAIKAYWKLLQSDPILLAEVDEIYSKKLLNYNRNLPSRKYKYLLQLTRLVQYCKTNNIDYRIDKTLQPALTELREASSISEIIKVENKIIGQLNPNNITAFEIWSIVNSGKEHIQYSSTKISNIFYKEHLAEIVPSNHRFNLFLKKSNLFKKFGDHGSSKYYLKKVIDNPSITTERLKTINNEILDEDILASIEYITNYKKRTIAGTKPIDFNRFLESPMSFEQEDLINITKTNKHSLSKLSTTFESQYSASDQFAILSWIKIHTPKELLPFIVSLKSAKFTVLSNQDIEVPVQDFASQILSTYISNDDMSAKNLPKEYIKVFQEIFKTVLDKVVKSDEIEIETINDIINSKFYNEEVRSIVLHGLTKVQPARNIIGCTISPKLSLAELQNLLPNIKSKNALEYLLKITDVNNNDAVMHFLIEHLSAKGSTKAGRFFNDLFKKQWFTKYIDSEATSSDLKMNIQWVLTNYWENEEGLSSFEEEQTILNIIKIELAGKSIKERLDLILSSFVDNEVKRQTIQKIIYQIDYQSIPVILEYYDQIREIGGLELFTFLADDFGIPTQDLSDREAIVQLSTDLKTLSEKELYFKYLDNIGIVLRNNDNDFDLNKAYNIITEDLVGPFVGSGGSVRDIYVFGTIKLLEKEFDKTLGFHPKLNESQSFYKYTSKKRAQAWAAELSKLLKAEL